jgi:excisionase family DNA binding protein
MSDLPSINAAGSGTVGGHALVDGRSAAIILQLLPPGWRVRLRDARVGEVEQVEQAVEALEAAAAGWRGEQLSTSANGNIGPAAATNGNGRPSESTPWITTSEAARELGVGERRVRQLASETLLTGEKSGGRWLYPRDGVAALRRLRQAYERELSD